MTPAALLILKFCAAHATMVLIPKSASVFCIDSNGALTSCDDVTTAKYDPGFEGCESVVPDLEAQQQAEKDEVNRKLYIESHAAEIHQLNDAIEKLKAEQAKEQAKKPSKPNYLERSTVTHGSNTFPCPDFQGHITNCVAN